MDLEGIGNLIRKVVREEFAAIRSMTNNHGTVPLRAAAEACHVEYRWLLERIQRREIPGYRPDSSSSWRVYISDINSFLTKTTNLEAPKKSRKIVTYALAANHNTPPSAQ